MFLQISLVGLALIALVAAIPQTHTPQEYPHPASLKEEHDQIHRRLVRLTLVKGEVGRAAQELADALHSHFAKEEETATPNLALLAPLVAGKKISGVDDAIARANKLRQTMKTMLVEHAAIRKAAEKLGKAGREYKVPEATAFAEMLVHHALNEEEVLYPAAILVGDFLKLKRTR